MGGWDELLAEPTAAFPPGRWSEITADERLSAVRRRLRDTPRQIDVERARFTTRSYRRTEGQPVPLRRATMLLDLAQQMSITIYPDELIVGNRSLLPRMGVIAPEGAVAWLDAELEGLSTRPQDRFEVSPEQIRELRDELFPYWRGKTLEDEVAARMPADVAAAARGRAFGLNQTDHAQGHILPDVESWLRLGIAGLRGEVERARARGKLGGDRQVFYDAAIIAVDAASTLICRYAELAKTLAAAAAPRRRAELLEIAQVCDRLAEHPARDFREALQATWFLFALLQVESNASSFSPGRLDQYLLPYLAADISSGRLTLAEAQMWLEHLWLKFNEVVLLRSKSSARHFAGFPIGFNVALGGQLPDGRDATNVLSYMCLRAQADARHDSAQPVHPHPRGQPAPVSPGRGLRDQQGQRDAAGVQRRSHHPRATPARHQQAGCPQLRDGGLRGAFDAGKGARVERCGHVEHGPHSRTHVVRRAGTRRPATQIGLETPPLDQLGSMAALEQAYEAQLVHFVGLMIEGCRVIDRIHAEMLPSPLLSLVVQDCIGRGRRRDGRRRHLQLLGDAGRADRQRGRQPCRGGAGGFCRAVGERERVARRAADELGRPRAAAATPGPQSPEVRQ